MSNTPLNVLFVDDELPVLASIERLFIDSDITIFKATNAEEALNIIDTQDIAILVTDNLMPGMKGIDLLEEVKERFPSIIRILFSGYADKLTALDAIKRDEVFYLIVKPWEDDLFLKTIEDAVNRYRLVTNLKKADESALLDIAQAIEPKDSYTMGHCVRVAHNALLIADSLSMSEQTKQEIKYGSWLHDCGKIGMDEEVFNYEEELNEKQFRIVKQHTHWGADIARQAQLSEIVVNIILYHHEKYNGKGYPIGLKGDNIPFEVRIVAIADVYDALRTNRPYRWRFSPQKALSMMTKMKGEHFDPVILEKFVSVIEKSTKKSIKWLHDGRL